MGENNPAAELFEETNQKIRELSTRRQIAVV